MTSLLTANAQIDFYYTGKGNTFIMKKFASLILILLFVTSSVAACGGDKNSTSSAADSDAQSYVLKSNSSQPADSSDTADGSEVSEPASEPEISEPTKSAIYTMSFEDIVKAVYAACDKPFDSYINGSIPEEAIAARYGDELECKEAYRSEPFWNVDPYLFELYRVDEDKAEEIAALVEEKADLNQWVCVSAEAKIAAVNGNVVMLCMSTKEECKELAEAFKGIE